MESAVLGEEANGTLHRKLDLCIFIFANLIKWVYYKGVFILCKSNVPIMFKTDIWFIREKSEEIYRSYRNSIYMATV